MKGKDILSQWVSKNSVWATWVLRSNEDGNGGIVTIEEDDDQDLVVERKRMSLNEEHTIMQTLERKYKESTILNEQRKNKVKWVTREGRKEDEEERKMQIGKILEQDDFEEPEVLYPADPQFFTIMEQYQKNDHMVSVDYYKKEEKREEEKEEITRNSSSSSSSSEYNLFMDSPKQSHRKKETSHALKRSKKWRVLVAMDNSIPAALANRTLKKEGVDVTTSLSIYGLNDLYLEEREAFRSQEEQKYEESSYVPYSFILFDYALLPDTLLEDILGDGRNFKQAESRPEELKERVLRHFSRCNVPIVLCIPPSLEGKREDFLSMGVQEVRTLPLGSKDILTVFQTYCSDRVNDS